jgi:hypothetical protein
VWGYSQRSFLRVVLAIVAALAAMAGPAHGSYRAVGDPAPRRTPGVTTGSVSQETIGTTVCLEEFTRDTAKVSRATKAQVFKRYGIKERQRSRFHVDLLVPLELGGTTALRNLWPQPRADRAAKDHVEESLHALVCSHHIDLVFAQQSIAQNWRGAEHAAQNAAATRASAIAEYLAAVESAERERALRDFVESLPPPTTLPRPPAASNPEPATPRTPLRPDLRPSCDTQGALDSFGNVCRRGSDGRLYWFPP